MIDKLRLKEVIDILTLVLRNEGDETITIGDQDYNRGELVNIISKYLYRIMSENPDHSEDYLLFFIDGIHYVMGYTDESPLLALIQKEEMQKVHDFYQKEKFKVAS